MNCSKAFGLVFILDHIPKAKRAAYHLAMAKHKSAEEQSYLPRMANIVTRSIERDVVLFELHNNTLLHIDIMAEHKKLQLTINRLTKIKSTPSSNEAIARRIEISHIRTQIQQVVASIAIVNVTAVNLRNRANNLQTVTDMNLVASRQCPAINPPCPGVITAANTCSVCTQIVCDDCGMLRQDGHVCAEDNLASIRLMRADTKFCPRCNVVVFRASGCNQMWCTQCHVNFDWLTLNILPNNTGHNPDRIAHQNQMHGNLIRDGLDLDCNPMRNLFRPVHADNNFRRLQSAVQMLGTYIAEIRPNEEDDYANLRLRLALSGYVNDLANKTYPVYTPEQHVQDIKKIMIKAQARHALCDILSILHAGVLSLMAHLEVRNTYDDMKALRKLCNRELVAMANRFGTSRYKLVRLQQDPIARWVSLECLTYRVYRNRFRK